MDKTHSIWLCFSIVVVVVVVAVVVVLVAVMSNFHPEVSSLKCGLIALCVLIPLCCFAVQSTTVCVCVLARACDVVVCACVRVSVCLCVCVRAHLCVPASYYRSDSYADTSLRQAALVTTPYSSYDRSASHADTPLRYAVGTSSYTANKKNSSSGSGLRKEICQFNTKRSNFRIARESTVATAATTKLELKSRSCISLLFSVTSWQRCSISCNS